MQVRGAPLIGATAAYGVWLALRDDASDDSLERAYATLLATRPTAINLKWALDEMMAAVRNRPRAERARRRLAARRRDRRRGRRHQSGDRPPRPASSSRRSRRARTASASTCSPIAMPAGWRRSIGAPPRRRSTWRMTRALPVHVFADETRPRNQGASLTAWELGHHGVPHTVIPDNTGGHLMQHGLVDLVIVGTDRVTAQGDVCNKIGTYLKALAAARQQRAVLCGAAVADHRLHGERRARRNPDRAARRRRSRDA